MVSLPAHYDFATLQKFPIRSIVSHQSKWKIANTLREQPYGAWAVHGDQIDVYLQVYPHISIPQGAEMCRKVGISILKEGIMNGILLVQFSKENIEAVAALPFVRYIELAPPPGEKEDTKGRTLHRSNMVDGEHALSKKFNGEGVNVLVRDDGRLGPHIDFQGRLVNLASGAETNGTHGDGVGGIIGGAANLDPTKKGMAAGSTIYTLDYVADFQDQTFPLFQDENVSITNSSYSNGCNAGYTTITQTVETQLFENPTYMHVFSAGNANGSNCNYGAGTQWGNITGGHKVAKNAIATANLKADATLDTTSSRGPAHDGRLKPDISANGNSHESTDPNNGYQVFGGTSGAAPGIAGCLAQLTHAYKTWNNGVEPPAALLKATIMNTANELGPIGPDWRFGWGQINAWRALRALEQQRYTYGNAEQGATATHSITIPNNTKLAKIMVYWAEPAADENSARALINDLDLTVTGPNGVVNLPWRLDPTPDPAILNTQAGKGRDSLNNTEQVAIENPAGGTYTVTISGTEVPLGPQNYVIVWEFLDDRVTLTYPNGGEGLVPGEVERIHWDAYGNTGSFTLRYSTDNGLNWSPVTTVTNTAQRMYDWTVPSTVTSGTVRFLVIRGSRRDTSDNALSIVRIPSNIQIDRVCPDSMTVSWTQVQDTLSYDVYLLGEKYMDIQGRSDTTFLNFPINNTGDAMWASVRTAHANGMTGRRAIAVNWEGGLKNCPQSYDVGVRRFLDPLGEAIVSCGANDQSVSVRVRNEGQNPINGGSMSYQVNGGTVITEALPAIAVGDSLDFTFSTPISITQNGNVNLKVWSTLATDFVDFNDTLQTALVAVVDATSTTFTESFDNSTTIPSGWAIINPDEGSTTFTSVNLPVGADGNPTRAVFIDFYNYGPNLEGHEDFLYMIPLDLSNLANPGITFDLSHAQYSDAFSDSLRVEVFPNCDLSATPVTVWGKKGANLSTVPASTNIFTPSEANDWRTEAIELPQFAGQSVVMRFVSTNGYGNSLYIDNISLKNVVVAPPSAVITAATDTVCRNVLTTFEAVAAGDDADYSWSFGTLAQPSTTAVGPGPHEVKWPTAGNKNIRLIVTNPFGADTALFTINVTNTPTANFTSTINNLSLTITNTSTNALSYLWDFGDGTTSTLANPTHTYANPGTYTVKLISTNACGNTEKTATVVMTSSTNDLSAEAVIRLTPNPTSGDFAVELNATNSLGEVQFNVLDATGRLVSQVQVHIKSGRTVVPFQGLQLPKGLYQVQIKAERGQQTLSLSVQ
jgi:hypothetical protein